ncbi:hypothetical protein CDD83_57 [Cordyceps sp. RAO-2017]|nr:hypothetical protein CDD83_57 [Cordyceps sp. RAO-2017]
MGRPWNTHDESATPDHRTETYETEQQPSGSRRRPIRGSGRGRRPRGAPERRPRLRSPAGIAGDEPPKACGQEIRCTGRVWLTERREPLDYAYGPRNGKGSLERKPNSSSGLCGRTMPLAMPSALSSPVRKVSSLAEDGPCPLDRALDEESAPDIPIGDSKRAAVCFLTVTRGHESAGAKRGLASCPARSKRVGCQASPGRTFFGASRSAPPDGKAAVEPAAASRAVALP